MKRIISIVLIISVLLVTALSYVTVSAENINFTMVDGYLNPTCREILSIEGAFTYDTTKYTRNADHIIDTNTTTAEGFDGQFFFHEGAGDKFVFTVDFGSFSVDKFAYKHYGGSSVPTVFNVYADEQFLGTGISTGGNGWLDNWDGYCNKKFLSIYMGRN